jgi:hypothetical protein
MDGLKDLKGKFSQQELELELYEAALCFGKHFPSLYMLTLQRRHVYMGALE